MRTVNPIKHEEKRQAILDAAINRFSKKGFQGTSVSAICSEADISAGQLYHYFENKEAILGAIAELALAQMTDHFEQVMSSADPMAALKTHVGRIRGLGTNAPHRLVLDLFSEAARNKSLAKILHRHSQGMKALVANVVRHGQHNGQFDPALNPEMAASTLIGIFDGAKIMPVRDPELEQQRAIDMLETLVERFIRCG